MPAKRKAGGAAKKKEPKKQKKEDEEVKEAAAEGKEKADLTLHADLQAKLAAYREKRGFDAKEWIKAKCEMFNQYCTDCGLKAAVVSISGGVDSAVTCALIKHAADMPNSPLKKILGVTQPIHSSQWAYDRAVETAKALGVDYINIDQTENHNLLVKKIDDAVGVKGKPFATGQLRSYMRTPSIYYVAQLLSQEGNPCIVMGTGNQDEDGYLAYFCKAGDGVVDVQLIADLHKSEVFKVGAELGVPQSTLKAAPSADLWPGQTDEDELGFSYDFIELFTGDWLKLKGKAAQAKWKKGLSKEGLEQFEKWGAAAEKVHARNSHKIGGPKNLNVF